MFLKVPLSLLANQSQKQRNLVLSQQLSRVLVARNNNHLRTGAVQPIFVVNTNQVRSFQSDKKWNNAGFIDTLAGIYEDPNYKLDLKPEVSEICVCLFLSLCVCMCLYI